ncbi:hypothetical protein BZA05DRAFT_441687 [Tricharina praecox]|uniref:uncharacterized protein n=1 Tax=Tricharina praecox TaxID=43433 RepID=UPI00221F9151|nr:uncharacterized protein BZA05DRAFT_441687 [Tricharina praecox]KAI5857057.1 hypothetical protein BZA05DRAFT_441687 [Tricharina praecox]
MQRSASQSGLYFILIGNIPWKCKWQDLKDLVREYSMAVEHVEIYVTPDGRSRGFGYVRVKGREEAMKVLQLDGREWEGRALITMLGNEHDVCPTGAGRKLNEEPATSRMSTPPLLEQLSPPPYGPPHSQPYPQMQPFPQAQPYLQAVGCGAWATFQDVYQTPPTPQPTFHDESLYGGNFMPTLHHSFQVGPAMAEYYNPPFYGSIFRYDCPPAPPPPPPGPPGTFPVHIDHSKPWVPPTPHTVTPISGGLPINLAHGAVVTEPRGIHVRNLKYDVTWRELRDHLAEAGTIVRCEVPKGSNGKGKGYGTVLFKTQQEAERCLELFKGSTLKGREIVMRRDKYATRKQAVDSEQGV